MSKVLTFSFVVVVIFVVTVMIYSYRVKNFQDKYECSINETAKLTSDNGKLTEEKEKLTNENTSLHQKISMEKKNTTDLQFKNNKLQSENKDLQSKIDKLQSEIKEQKPKYNCSLCKDTHKIDCIPCDGKGIFSEKCEQCKGRGFIIHTNCQGTGIITCDYCKGKFHKSEWRDCKHCDGYGNAKCGCKDNGKPTCNKCDGHKTTGVKCKICKGEGTTECSCIKKDASDRKK